MDTTWVICCIAASEVLGLKVFSRFAEGRPQFSGVSVVSFENNRKTISPTVFFSKEMAEEKLTQIADIDREITLYTLPLATLVAIVKAWR